MLYAEFVSSEDPSQGAAIYWDGDKSPYDRVQQDSPLVVADWDEWHRLILEIQALREQRDVLLRRASLTLVSADREWQPVTAMTADLERGNDE